jgi:metal-responsive CopG/Arc/MetJ family transcriptional regulator
MARREQSRKVRVTATLPSDMVKALDQTTKRRGLSSRSRALEIALTHWLRETRRREIEQEVEAYYRSLTAMEKREDREWAQFASRSNRRLWD